MFERERILRERESGTDFEEKEREEKKKQIEREKIHICKAKE